MLEKEKLVDLVAGPDAYRDLPRLIAAVQVGLENGPASGMTLSGLLVMSVEVLKAPHHRSCASG